VLIKSERLSVDVENMYQVIGPSYLQATVCDEDDSRPKPHPGIITGLAGL
jgi:hypothetical protein